MIAFVELAVHWKTDHTNHLLIVLTFCGLAAALAEEIADDHTFGIFVAFIAPREVSRSRDRRGIVKRRSSQSRLTSRGAMRATFQNSNR